MILTLSFCPVKPKVLETVKLVTNCFARYVVTDLTVKCCNYIN